MKTTSPALKQESANLDFLRAVAVLAVFVDHLISTFGRQEMVSVDLWRLGRLGVLIFFVHTSLVLMMSMDRLNLKGGALFGSFYLRRCFRIYPLSIVAVSLAVLLQWPSAPWRPAFHWPGWGALASNLALTQNLTFSDSVLGPLWSLPYEVQMYLVLPLIWLLLRRYDSPIAAVALWAAAVGAALAQPHLSARLDFVKFAPCFMGGITAYQLSKRRTLRLPFLGWPFVILAGMAGFILFDESRRGWAVCLLLGVAAPQFREMTAPWLKTASHWIAKYSYGIYLSHIVVMWFAFVYLKAAAPVQWLVFWTLSVAAPVAAYHLVEHPMIRFGNRLAIRFSSSPATELRQVLAMSTTPAGARRRAI